MEANTPDLAWESRGRTATPQWVPLLFCMARSSRAAWARAVHRTAAWTTCPSETTLELETPRRETSEHQVVTQKGKRQDERVAVTLLHRSHILALHAGVRGGEIAPQVLSPTQPMNELIHRAGRD